MAGRGRVSVSVRLDAEAVETLRAEADARVVSFNWMMQRAVDEFLARLVPAEAQGIRNGRRAYTEHLTPF